MNGNLVNRRRISLSRNRMLLAISGALTTLLIAGVTTTAVALVQESEQSSPATGHAQVVAQFAVKLPTGDVQWVVTERTAEPPDEDGEGTEPTSVTTNGFVLADESALILADGDGARQRLGSGEAAAYRAGSELGVTALSDEEVTYYTIDLVRVSSGGNPTPATAADDDEESPATSPGEVLLSSDEFESPGGERDIDLIRDVLEEGEEFELPASQGDDAQTLVLVTAGEVSVAVDDEDAEILDEGSVATFAGDLTVTTEDPDGGTFVAAVIGADVDASLDEIDTTGASVSVRTSPTPTTGTTSAPPTHTPETPTPTVTLVDTDSDGLYDSEETAYGSDPHNPDTDNDGLLDGAEVNDHGSSPTSMDTDSDGLPDYNEVTQHNTNPAVADTDGDGYNDHDELGYPLNPLNPDTDGDGLMDGDEIFNIGTNANMFDTDGDGLGDGQEVSNGTSPTLADTDGDGRDDGNELGIGTDPNNPDTDGDGMNDLDDPAPLAP